MWNQSYGAMQITVTMDERLVDLLDRAVEDDMLVSNRSQAIRQAVISEYDLAPDHGDSSDEVTGADDPD